MNCDFDICSMIAKNAVMSSKSLIMWRDMAADKTAAYKDRCRWDGYAANEESRIVARANRIIKIQLQRILQQELG